MSLLEEYLTTYYKWILDSRSNVCMGSGICKIMVADKQLRRHVVLQTLPHKYPFIYALIICFSPKTTPPSHRYLNWADYLHTVQVKSINDSNRHMGRAVPSNTSIVFTLFSIHPLNFIACFAVDEQVSL